MKLEIDVDHFRARVLQDALTEATSQYWRRRAEAFDAARPNLDDYNGHATAEELAKRDKRCAETAQACRNRATLHHPADTITPEVLAALAEVA